VLWANRRREDCVGAKPPQKWSLWPWRSAPSSPGKPNAFIQGILDLERVTNGLVTFDFLVDEEGSFINASQVANALKAKPASADARPGTKLLIVSGPDGFTKYLAGPRILCDGADIQSPIEGQLGRLPLHGWTVVKL